MAEGNSIFWLTDNTFPSSVKEKNRAVLILFESRYPAAGRKMLNVIKSVLPRFQPEIVGGVCIIEEAPMLCRRFNVLGVPTVVAISGDSVLGESIGLRTEDELVHLIEMWLSGQHLQKQN